MPITRTPFVSILIPTFNEEGFISECLNSIFNNNFPHDKLEILVIDGGSTDNTIKEVGAFCSLNPEVKLIHNPKKIVPAAMNIGISEAKHSIILWLGAHAIYQNRYISNSVSTLLEEKCSSVGGVISPIGKTLVGQAIAAATTSKFGIGNAKYRNAKKRQEVDTVFGGCWLKENILSIGGFNENWVRNQDYELNFRLRKRIGPIILEPTIQCQYYCRETIPSLAKQYFQYGFWRFNTLLKHPKSFTLRQGAPLFLLVGLLLSLVMCLTSLKYALVIPVLYLLSTIIFSAKIAYEKKRPTYLLLLPFIFPSIHLSWAFGFVIASLSRLNNLQKI